MTILHIDFETRSVLDLREVGLHNYARHPTTSPWCMAYAEDDGNVRLWHPDAPPPAFALHLVKEGAAVVAHNAPLELAIWNDICAPRYGWPELKPEQTYCTMAH